MTGVYATSDRGFVSQYLSHTTHTSIMLDENRSFVGIDASLYVGAEPYAGC